MCNLCSTLNTIFYLNSCMSVDFSGEEYIEQWKNPVTGTVTYYCTLCGCQFDSKLIVPHSKGLGHKLQYKVMLIPQLNYQTSNFIICGFKYLYYFQRDIQSSNIRKLATFWGHYFSDLYCHESNKNYNWTVWVRAWVLSVRPLLIWVQLHWLLYTSTRYTLGNYVSLN